MSYRMPHTSTLNICISLTVPLSEYSMDTILKRTREVKAPGGLKEYKQLLIQHLREVKAELTADFDQLIEAEAEAEAAETPTT